MRGIAILLALFLATAGFTQGPLLAIYQPIEASFALEQALLYYTNQERARAGLAPLAHHDALALAARHHAREMAELRFMSHASPNPQNTFAGNRVANSGSPLANIAENLARVPDNADAPATTVQGWMDSPGHRANLLAPNTTHVGFGVAPTDDGALMIVQVLARAPIDLLEGDALLVPNDETNLLVTFETRIANDVAFEYANRQLPPERLVAGQHTITLPYAGNEPVHVRGAVRSQTGTGFIGQDGGWFDPLQGSFAADSTAPRQDLRIVSLQRQVQREPVFRVTLQLDRAPPQRIGIWLDGEFMGDFEQLGSQLVFDVPVTARGPRIEIAMEAPEEGGRFAVLMGFTVEVVAGEPRLVPQARER